MVILLTLQVSAYQAWTKYEPIFMTRSEMERAVASLPPREIETPGKIWLFNQYIFVIEQFRGIHVIDNSTPDNPVNIAFIHVDGCTDLAVTNGIIYTNNAVDLIAIKPDEDLQSIAVISRNRNALPAIKPPPPLDDHFYRYYSQFLEEDHIVVRWIENR